MAMTLLVSHATFSFGAGAIYGTLGSRVTINKLDNGHWRVIAVPESCFENSRVTTGAFRIATAQNVKQFFDLRFIAHLGHRLATAMNAAAFGHCDKLVNKWSQFLGFRQSGYDLLVLDEGCGHIGQHRAAVRVRAVKLAMCDAVTHG
jgi:hypothetical protein